MIASIFIKIFVSSVSVFLMSNAIADASPPTLARFANGDHSLQMLVEFPDVDSDVAEVVYCLARVGRNGNIAKNHCFPSENVDRSFRDAIDTAIKSARASPATVDGKTRSVRLYYRVAFIQKDGAAELGDSSAMNRCENSIKSTYKDFKFIPGHQNGQPVEATFVEAWWDD